MESSLLPSPRHLLLFFLLFFPLASPFAWGEDSTSSPPAPSPEATSTEPATTVIPTAVVPVEERESAEGGKDLLLSYLGISLAPAFSFTVRDESQELSSALGFDRSPSRWGEGWEVRLGFRLFSHWFPFLRYQRSSRSREEYVSLPGIRRLTEENQSLEIGATRILPIQPWLFCFLGGSLGGGSLRYLYTQEAFQAPIPAYADYLADLKGARSSSTFTRSILGSGVSAGIRGGVGTTITSGVLLAFEGMLDGGYYPGGSFQDEGSGVGLRGAPKRVPLRTGFLLGLLLLSTNR